MAVPGNKENRLDHREEGETSILDALLAEDIPCPLPRNQFMASRKAIADVVMDEDAFLLFAFGKLVARSSEFVGDHSTLPHTLVIAYLEGLFQLDAAHAIEGLKNNEGLSAQIVNWFVKELDREIPARPSGNRRRYV